MNPTIPAILQSLTHWLRREALETGVQTGLLEPQQPKQLNSVVAHAIADQMGQVADTHQLATLLLFMPAVPMNPSRTGAERWSQPLANLDVQVGTQRL
jgi:hypothetical protein